MEILTTEERTKKFGLWAVNVRQFTNKFVCPYCVFVTEREEISYGSDVQKAACQNMMIPDEFAEEFWNDVGCDAVEEAIRRKRNTLTNSLKARFQKYCKDPERNNSDQPIRPPDPLKWLPTAAWKGVEKSLPMQVEISLRAGRTDPLEGEEEEASDTELNQEEMDEIVDAGVRAASNGEYKRYLRLFGGCFIQGGAMQMSSELLSTCMTTTIEAFALVLYVNNYWKYMSLYWDQGGESVSTMTTGSGINAERTLFTRYARGAAKYEGWSHEGYLFFNRIYDVLGRQRADEAVCKSFEEDLRKTVSNESARKRKRSSLTMKVNNQLHVMRSLFDNI